MVGNALNTNENLNNDYMNRGNYFNIDSYEVSIVREVSIILHACTPQWLTNIKAQQHIEEYG